MRIGFISDLHIDVNTRYDFTRLIPEAAQEQGLDILIFVGDTGTGAQECLKFYDEISRRMKTKIRVIPGNHDTYVWDLKGKTSREISKESTSLGNRLLFHPEYSLIKNPVITSNWAITGVEGWFDYSFHQKGEKADLDRVSHNLINRYVWPDERFIHGGVIDAQRNIRQVEKEITLIKKVFEKEECKGKKKCVVTHMLPTKDLVRRYPIPFYSKFINQLGSERYRSFYEQSGVKLSVSGHSHMPMKIRRNGVVYANVSLGYGFQWSDASKPLEEIKKVMYILEDEC